VIATSSGGNATVTITASDALCPWTASSVDLSVAPAGGSGNGSVIVTVPPNTAPSPRTLTASIAGHAFGVTQGGIDCIVSLSPYAASVPVGGTTGSVEITTPPGCSYGTVLGPSWISVTSGASGSGPGTLVYSVDPNSTTLTRSGTLTIGGQSFVVNQAPQPCSVTVDTTGLGSPYGTGVSNGTIDVATNGANCGWSASSSVPWAAISPSSAAGNGSVSVLISANGSTVARSGALTVAGQTINISQSGLACTYALDARHPLRHRTRVWRYGQRPRDRAEHLWLGGRQQCSMAGCRIVGNERHVGSAVRGGGQCIGGSALGHHHDRGAQLHRDAGGSALLVCRHRSRRQSDARR
jgi:hypothetical protein